MIPEILTRKVAHLASGDSLAIQYYRFVGQHPGKKVYLQSNLHGAEISGNLILQQLIKLLCDLDPDQLQGEVWIVPACNPFSINQRSHHFSSGRYNPYTGNDWNRIFWDYEVYAQSAEKIDPIASIKHFAKIHQTATDGDIIRHYRQAIREAFAQIALEFETPNGLPLEERFRYHLQDLCLDADYVIDLHSSSNQAVDYLYCFPGREHSAKSFLMQYGILMDSYDGYAFDEAFLKPWLALEREFKLLDRPLQFDIEAWTLEIGSGMEANADSVYRGFRGIKNYLVSKDVLELKHFPLIQTLSHTTDFFRRQQIIKYYAPWGGTIESLPLLGSIIHTDQRLYQLVCFGRDRQTPNVISVPARQTGIVFDVARNGCVNQGEYVLSVMEYDSESINP